MSRSPQILYDLYDSSGIENGLERINSRGRMELEAMQTVLNKAAALSESKFPVKVREECNV